jgi:hypothetical protein
MVMDKYEDNEPPDWFTAIDPDLVAAELDEHLYALLAESVHNGELDGELGVALAERLTTSKYDNYHDPGTEPEQQYDSGDEILSVITEKLSQQLKVILQQHGATLEDVEFAVVRRWDMLAANHNQCYWVKSWSGGRNGRWCWSKVCC